ncbi:MAG: phosphopantetheine-binding protein [Saprospiraceae bacterium]
MEQDRIIEIVQGFLVEEFEVPAENILSQANLRNTIGLDSLDYIDLVVVIESNFGFKVQAEDFAAIDSFQDFYDYISKNIRNKQTAS